MKRNVQYKSILAIFLNEIKCHMNTSFGLVGGCIPCDFSSIHYVVKSHYGFATVRVMKYISQHCYDKIMDGKWSYTSTLFSELYKIMENKVTFVGFTGVIAPIASPWIRHCVRPCLVVDPL